MDTLEILNALDTVGNLDEEEELVQDPDRHKNLLKSLGVEEKQESLKPRKSTRSEATNDVSVFSLNPGSKVKLHDLVKNVKGTINVNVLKEKLAKFEDRNTQLSALLPRITADKVERDAAYEESSNKISKWDEVVKRNRESEQLSFPLKHENMQIHTVDEYVQKFKPKTPLEEQIYSLLKGSKFQENPETGLSQAEEEVLRSVSLQEAKRRRAELQKHRALLSYHEAKNRRLSKIKSKRHLRIVRKRKEKKSVAEFEKLQQTDPEKANEKLQLAQKSRAEERAVLRHRQGSKWAKNRMLIARYNEMTKVQLQEQRKLHNNLVQRNGMKIENSDGDEEEEEEEEEMNPLVSPTASLPTVYLPKDNPWLKQQSKSSAVTKNSTMTDGKKVIGVEYNRNRNAVLGLEEVSAKKDAESEDESEDDEAELKLELSELKDRKRLRQIMESEDVEPKESAIQEESITNFRAALADLKKEKKKATEDKSIEESDEERQSSEQDELEIGLERRKNLEDFNRVLETENDISSLSQLSKTATVKVKTAQTKKPKQLKQIDPDKVFTIESKELKAVHDVDGDDESDDGNRMTIQEAFADDDVLADFVAEKKKIIDDSKPKVQDLSLPGWGEWAGGNLKPSKRKRKRLSVKPPPAPQRKDSHLGAVIINENKDSHIAKHQVRQLPYGFANFEQYERSIRQPIGKTWNTPSAFKNLTKPKVTTVMGAIIDPMDEADAFDSSKVGDRKRSLQGEGDMRFDDEPAENIRFKRKRGNKKHKK